MEPSVYLHVEGARYNISDEDVGNPTPPIRNPSQHCSIPIIEHAESYHLQPPVPWEGVSLLSMNDGFNQVGVGKAVEIESSQRKNDVKQIVLEGDQGASKGVKRKDPAVVR